MTLPTHSTETKYALIEKENRAPATFTHQDDTETTIVSETLPGLIDLMATWTDTDTDFVRKYLRPNGEFLWQGIRYQIIRQEIESFSLNPKEEALLQETP